MISKRISRFPRFWEWADWKSSHGKLILLITMQCTTIWMNKKCIMIILDIKCELLPWIDHETIIYLTYWAKLHKLELDHLIHLPWNYGSWMRLSMKFKFNKYFRPLFIVLYSPRIGIKSMYRKSVIAIVDILWAHKNLFHTSEIFISVFNISAHFSSTI